MTLFDGKLLTEEEVRARDVCKCGHTYGQHRGGGECTQCACGTGDGEYGFESARDAEKKP